MFKNQEIRLLYYSFPLNRDCIYKYAKILLSKNDPLHSNELSEIISKNNAVRGQRAALAELLKKIPS